VKLRVTLVLSGSRLGLSRFHVVLDIKNVDLVLAEFGSGDFGLLRTNINSDLGLGFVVIRWRRLEHLSGNSKPIFCLSKAEFGRVHSNSWGQSWRAHHVRLVVGAWARQIFLASKVPGIISVRPKSGTISSRGESIVYPSFSKCFLFLIFVGTWWSYFFDRLTQNFVNENFLHICAACAKWETSGGIISAIITESVFKLVTDGTDRSISIWISIVGKPLISCSEWMFVFALCFINSLVEVRLLVKSGLGNHLGLGSQRWESNGLSKCVWLFGRRWI